MYAGQYKDSESGLYYLRTRYYDPATAQFLTRDPANTTTRSPDAYVAGNPLNATDASGRSENVFDGSAGDPCSSGAPGNSTLSGTVTLGYNSEWDYIIPSPYNGFQSMDDISVVTTVNWTLHGTTLDLSTNTSCTTQGPAFGLLAPNCSIQSAASVKKGSRPIRLRTQPAQLKSSPKWPSTPMVCWLRRCRT
jgi:RHS repeat-associated protein